MHSAVSTKKILNDSLEFFLGLIARELSCEIDWRAKGYGRNVFMRILIYAVALVRDVIRIPLHHRRGIAQAQFRFRVSYIEETAIPTLELFVSKYPLHDRQTKLLRESIELLRQGSDLMKDGRVLVVDQWYATMEEFHWLTQYSEEAGRKLQETIDIVRKDGGASVDRDSNS
jgi:hypothetical protein